MTKNPGTQARRALAQQTPDLTALVGLKLGELHAKYREVFGEETRSHNKPYLQRRIAERIQELAGEQPTGEPVPAPRPAAAKRRHRPAPMAKGTRKKKVPKSRSGGRDPRLPPVGTVIKKTYHGKVHE